MTRAVRGAWSRRGVLATLALMAAVVVAGAATVIGFAEAAGSSRLLAVPLLLLGAVAVPAIGRELATARREEIGLARLRGIHGGRLVAVLLGEPAVAIVLGAVVGLGLARLLVPPATARWLDAAGSAWTPSVLLTALGIGVAGLVAVLLGSWSALREPLALQVSTATRPRPSTTVVLFLGLLAIVGATVAVYRSRVVAGDPDLLVLLGPALLGLALGQVAVWCLRGGARAVLGSTARGRWGGRGGRGGRGGMATFLASRRLARADDLTGPVRLVVAAGVVAALAAGAATSVSGWSDAQARVDLAGPRVVPLADEGAVGALALTHRLDPEGTALMAAVLLPGNDRLEERRAYVDTSRWAAVSGDTLAGTDAALSRADLAALAPDVPGWAGPADRFTVGAALGPDTPPGRYVVGVEYVADGDVLSSVEARLRVPADGAARLSVPLDDCATGCQPRSLTLVPGAPGGDGVPDVRRLRLTSARFGDVDLLAAPWRPGTTVADRWVPVDPEQVPKDAELVAGGPAGLDVLLVPWAETRVELVAPPVAVLAAGDRGAAAAYGTPGGDDRRADVVAARDLLPLVGSGGTLADLVAGAWASSPTGASAQTFVVVADDAPADVVAALAERAGAAPRGLAGARSGVEEASGGSQSGAYLLMAGACLAVALLALAAGAARLRRAHARDVAALRTVGAPVRTARAAGRGELAVVALLVGVVVVAGGWLAVRLLLPGLPLLDVSAGGVPFRPDPRLVPLLGPGLLAATAVVVLGGRARRVTAGSSRPSLLREEEGR